LAWKNGVFARFTRAALFVQGHVWLEARLPVGGVARGDSRDGALCVALEDRANRSIVAVAGLSEQPRDGKVPGDPRMPFGWRLPGQPPPARVAYICNLAVRSAWRNRGLGTALLHSLEAIAEREWGADEVYLHAATKQPRLLQMYAKLGYEELPSFDQPGWLLAWSGREPTRYHVKRLGLREAIGSA
jgi:ribosomal protein S18 acetylase RimI-like enzyme